jgi:hypothetical protein
MEFSCVDKAAPTTEAEVLSTIAPAASMSIEEAARVLAWKDTVMQMFSALEERLKNELEAGRPVPGFKLVDGRSNRKYISEDEVIKEFEPILGPRIYEKKLLGPAKLEKLLGGKGKLDHLTMKPQASKTIARDSDPRRATVTSAQSDFAVLTNDKGEALTAGGVDKDLLAGLI